MKWYHPIIMLLLCVALSAQARTLYVSPYGTNDAAGKYPDWAGAASTIPPALNVATNGDKVLVTDGVYTVTSQLWVTNGFTLISVNGRNVTSINGNYPNTTNRCMYVSHSNTVVSGFTISNAYYDSSSPLGAGVAMVSGLLTNCVVERNRRYYNPNVSTWYGPGGGVGMYAGQVRNCVIRYNTANMGGGVYMTGGRLVDCDIYSNSAVVVWAGHGGGGVCMNNGGEVTNCVIGNNSSAYGGSGVWLTTNCTLRNSRITGNNGSSYGLGMMLYNGGVVRECMVDRNSGGGAGAVYLFYGGLLRNCLIYNNSTWTGSSTYHGGGILGRYSAGVEISSCTIANNYAYGAGGGIYFDGGGDYTTNCIIYGNTGGAGQNEISSTATTNLSYCCLSSTNNIIGPGNITNAPQFVESTNYNYRLSKTSRCINTGIIMDWMPESTDLDGRPRLDRFSGQTDMGAYEYLSPGTLYNVH